MHNATFCTSDGQAEYEVMPFGLNNVHATYHAYVND